MTDTLRQPLRIAADHPSLPGHFPGNPVVPGVVLLDAVAAMVENVWQCSVRGLPQVKFARPLRPDEDAEIVLERSGDSCRFRIEVAGDVIASGALEHTP